MVASEAASGSSQVVRKRVVGTAEELEKAGLPQIELKDMRVVEDSTVDSGKGMSGGPVYKGRNKQQVQLRMPIMLNRNHIISHRMHEISQ